MIRYTDAEIARVCHEANRGLQHLQEAHCGIPVADPWDDVLADDQDVAIAGVAHARTGLDPEAMHQKWVEAKVAQGWTYAQTKDAGSKTHPDLVPFADLPADQRIKDELFTAIVTVFR